MTRSTKTSKDIRARALYRQHGEQIEALLPSEFVLPSGAPIFGFSEAAFAAADKSQFLSRGYPDSLCLAPFEDVPYVESQPLARRANLTFQHSDHLNVIDPYFNLVMCEPHLARCLAELAELPMGDAFTRGTYGSSGRNSASAENSGGENQGDANRERQNERAGIRDDFFPAHKSPPSMTALRWQIDPFDVHELEFIFRSLFHERLSAFMANTVDWGLHDLCKNVPTSHRLAVYRFAVGHEHRRQLVLSHLPLACKLADLLESACMIWEPDQPGSDVLSDRAFDLVRMVDSGKPLKQICAAADVPYWTRRVLTGEATEIDHVLDLEDKGADKTVLDFMPDTALECAEWLLHISTIGTSAKPPVQCVHPDAMRHWRQAVRWFAQHSMSLADTRMERINRSIEIRDFLVSPAHTVLPTDVVQNGAQAGTAMTLANIHSEVWPLDRQHLHRAFQPELAPQTLLQRVEEWHEELAVAQAVDIPDFPQAPFDEVIKGRAKLSPVRDAVGLYREGREMRHCVATYTQRVLNYEGFIYSYSYDGERIATVEVKPDFPLDIIQISGPRNALVEQSHRKRIHNMVAEQNGVLIERRLSFAVTPGRTTFGEHPDPDDDSQLH